MSRAISAAAAARPRNRVAPALPRAPWRPWGWPDACNSAQAMGKDWGTWVEQGREEARRDALWLLGTVAVLAVLTLALVVITA